MLKDEAVLCKQACVHGYNYFLIFAAIGGISVQHSFHSDSPK